MIFPEDERVLKPLINIETSCDAPNTDHYHEELKDLHSHTVKDDLERIEVEQYLNQGEGDYLQEITGRKSKAMSQVDEFHKSDHPPHKIDPDLEKLRN